MKIEMPEDMDSAEYEQSRARFEEIKKRVNAEEEQVEDDQILENQPIDIEAENRAVENRDIDAALVEDAKVDLDDRLKQAADEAKAKGKKTIRTFDMLRKAISGDPGQRNKQE